MGFGAIWMVLFWVLVIGAIVLLVRGVISFGQAGRAKPGGRTPLDILAERYAKGEIGKDEFEEKRQILIK